MIGLRHFRASAVLSEGIPSIRRDQFRETAMSALLQGRSLSQDSSYGWLTGNPSVTTWATTRNRPVSSGKISTDMSAFRRFFLDSALARGLWIVLLCFGLRLRSVVRFRKDGAGWRHE
jgi:hypothetical protein